MFIGGWGCARGYQNRPDLTSQKFVEDVFSKELRNGLDEFSPVMYESGDVCRFLANGDVECLGKLLRCVLILVL